MPKRVFAASLTAMMLASFAAQAQPAAQDGLDTWKAGLQMGTAWAGVATSQGGIRVTAYCGDKTSAAANPAIQAGPSLTISMEKVTPPQGAKTIRLLIDGKATTLPVSIEQRPDAVDFDWTPSRAFDAARMRALLTSLRSAKRFELEVAGAARDVPLAGVRQALDDEIVTCR